MLFIKKVTLKSIFKLSQVTINLHKKQPMNEKITVSGQSKPYNTFLALVLSNLTGIPYIRNKTMYEWCKLCGVDDSDKLKWKDMIIISSLSFYERAATELHYDQFISDGISFTELVWLKSNFEKQHFSKRKNEWSRIIGNMEKVSVAYANQQYDIIIHNSSDSNVDDLYIQLYKKFNLTYKAYNTECLETIVDKIANDLKLRRINTIENAIYQAKTNIYNLFIKET